MFIVGDGDGTGRMPEPAESRMQNRRMTNLATTLKSEIARIARKETRAELEALKKSIGTYRSEIAALKRRAQSLEQEVRRLGKGLKRRSPNPVEQTEKGKHRFSAKSLASQRQRLGLSAVECGFLVGASSQSIYNWESGTARPREKHLAAIAALRAMGKKEAAARVAAAQVAPASGVA